MPTGNVKFFNAAKGFGFISPDEGGKDVFVTAASVTAAGLDLLKAGQRVSFETKPDAKGPKAVNLTVLAEAPPQKRAEETPRPVQKTEAAARLTFYHDPAYDKSHDALADLHDAGYEPRVIDYIASPPTRDELRNLSRLLGDSNQSLVRRHDPLFHDLRLDDRFISQNELLDAIVEHPSLINGPIVATATRANTCRAENSVRSFLAAAFPGTIQEAPRKERAVSARAEPEEEPEDEEAEAKPARKARSEVKDATAKKTKAVAKAKTAKEPAKKAAVKPVKKSVRTAKK